KLDVLGNDLLKIAACMKRMHVKAVAQFPCKPAHPAVDPGNINRDVRIVMRARIKERGHEVESKKFAVEVEPRLILPAIPNRPDRQNRVAHLFDRSLPLDPESPLVMSLDLSAEPHNETALGEASQIPPHVCENRGAPRKSHGDAGPEGQTPAMFGSQHERQKGFMRGFEGPEPVEIHSVRRSRQSRHLAEVVNEKAGVNLHHVIFDPMASLRSLGVSIRLGEATVWNAYRLLFLAYISSDQTLTSGLGASTGSRISVRPLFTREAAFCFSALQRRLCQRSA